MEKIFTNKCKELGIELPFRMRMTNEKGRPSGAEVMSPITAEGTNIFFTARCIMEFQRNAKRWEKEGTIETAELFIGDKVVKGKDIVPFLEELDCFPPFVVVYNIKWDLP